MAKYQEEAIKSSLKKNYSVLKQALDNYQFDNGQRIYLSEIDGYHKLKTILTKYLNVIYDCGLGHDDASSKACIANTGSQDTNSKNYMNYTGTNYVNLNYFDDGQFVLNDGSFILLEDYTLHKYFSVDVNGINKKPNRLGKDLFMFQLTEEGELLPMGAKNTTYYGSTDTYCSKSSTNAMNGAGCTYKILQEN